MPVLASIRSCGACIRIRTGRAQVALPCRVYILPVRCLFIIHVDAMPSLSVHKALCSWLFEILWRFGVLGLCGLLLVEFNLVDKEDHLWNGPVHAVQPDGDL
jgi:hypothetical protein